MSQRNRIVIVLGLLAALFLIAPAPSRAFGLWEEGLPTIGFMERIWSWMTELWSGGDSAGTSARWEKEGSVINPDGQPRSTATPPQSNDEGRQ